MKCQDYVKCNSGGCNIAKDMPQFYKEILEAWFNMKVEPTDTSGILRETIWYNKNIEIEPRPIFKKKMYENGMNMNLCIPRNWRVLLRDLNSVNIFPHQETVCLKLGAINKPVKLVKSKHIYWHLNDKRKVKPNCIAKGLISIM